jgi:hypothetical protein
VSISKSDTSFPSMFPMKLDSNNSLLPYRAAIAEISFNGCNAFQQWLDVCNDAATNNIVDELFFEEPVDIDMIVDFCSTWMPSINDVTSRQR